MSQEDVTKNLPLWARLRIAHDFADDDEKKKLETLAQDIIDKHPDSQCNEAIQPSCHPTGLNMICFINSCQTACEHTCQTACEHTCQTACLHTCQNNCLQACQYICLHTCQNTYETACLHTCQNTCPKTTLHMCTNLMGCQSNCKSAQLHSTVDTDKTDISDDDQAKQS